jgi:hypothetical protein
MNEVGTSFNLNLEVKNKNLKEFCYYSINYARMAACIKYVNFMLQWQLPMCKSNETFSLTLK